MSSKKRKSQFQSCPICYKSFSIQTIQIHASTCGSRMDESTLGTPYNCSCSNSTNSIQSPIEKIGLDFVSMDEENEITDSDNNNDNNALQCISASNQGYDSFFNSQAAGFTLWNQIKCTLCQSIYFKTQSLHPCRHMFCQPCIIQRNTHSNNHQTKYILHEQGHQHHQQQQQDHLTKTVPLYYWKHHAYIIKTYIMNNNHDKKILSIVYCR